MSRIWMKKENAFFWGGGGYLNSIRQIPVSPPPLLHTHMTLSIDVHVKPQ